MEAVKYEYGTTPEEVIRERVFRGEESRITLTEVSGTARLDLNPDDLLTVLDALKWRSMVYMDSDDPADVERNKNPEFSPSGVQRIQILAALGIDES